jgi:hypothetical protein
MESGSRNDLDGEDRGTSQSTAAQNGGHHRVLAT